MLLVPPKNLLKQTAAEPRASTPAEEARCAPPPWETSASDVHLVVLRDSGAPPSSRKARRRGPPGDLSEIEDAEHLESFTVEALKSIGRQKGLDFKGVSTWWSCTHSKPCNCDLGTDIGDRDLGDKFKG